MDRERLTRLLEEPSRVGREDLTDLRSLTERFPWFSGAQLLLAVGEHATGDVLFDEQLKVTAAHLPSRSVLFDGVRNESFHKPPVKLTVVREQHVPVGTPIAERSRPLPPEEVPVESLPVVPWNEELANAAATEEIVPSTAAPIPSPEAEQKPGPAILPSRTIPGDLLDEQMRQAAVAGSYDLERSVAAPLTEAPVYMDVLTVRDRSPEQVPRVPSASVPQHSFAREPDALSLAEQPPTVTMSSRLRFTDWLARSEASAAPSVPFGTLPTGPEVNDWLRASEQNDALPILEKVPEALPRVHSTEELVDGFIQRSAPVAAQKAEFFTPQQAAKRSLQDDGLVSETLARIYEKQGNIAKAMETYQRLALKHPEKSVYFAALSKALEGRSNK